MESGISHSNTDSEVARSVYQKCVRNGVKRFGGERRRTWDSISTTSGRKKRWLKACAGRFTLISDRRPERSEGLGHSWMTVFTVPPALEIIWRCLVAKKAD